MKELFTFGKVFCANRLLPKILEDDFEVISLIEKDRCKGYIKNSKGVWWIYASYTKAWVKFVTADVDNFSIINEDYSKDGRFVYQVNTQVLKIPNSDPDSFHVLEDSPYFAKDKNQAYALSGSAEGLIIIDNVDVKTFGSCGWNAYAVDKDHLFHYNYHFVEVSNASKFSDSFNLIQDARSCELEDIYKKNQVFLHDKYPEIQGWWHPEYPEPLMYKQATKSGYIKVSNRLFYMEEASYSAGISFPNLIRDLHVGSFESLDQWYGKAKIACFSSG